MTKQKSTKRALLASVLSLVLCISMLVGSTFAWFTDSATTGVNKIVSGNLDIKLSYKNAAGEEYSEVSANTTDLFVNKNGGEILWEPGAASVCYFKIENLGSLSLKYVMSVLYEDVVTANDGAIKLSDALVSAIVPMTEGETPFADSKAAIEAANRTDSVTALGYANDANPTVMPAGDTDYFAMVVYMPETVGNDYNVAGGLAINLYINLVATQAAVESDSYNNSYDENAPTLFMIGETEYETLAAAIAAAKDGDTIAFSGKISLPTDGSLKNRTLTFEAIDKNVSVIDMKNVATGQSTGGASLTFKGADVVFGNKNYMGIQHAAKVAYEDCTIYGKQFLYAPAEFTDCKFINYTDYAVWTYGSTAANFTDCTFTTGGKAVLVYTEGKIDASHTFTDCTFTGNGQIATDKAAIEVGSSPNSAETTYSINIDNCTANGFAANKSNSPLWGNKNNMDSEHLSVKIDSIAQDIVLFWDGSVATVSEPVEKEVNGETIKVVEIDSPAELAGLAAAVNAGTTYEGVTVTLTEDMNLQGIEWTPMGSYSTGKYFKGTLDGQGHTVSNLTAGDGSTNDQGFIGATSGTVVVKNITFDSAFVETKGRGAVVIGHAVNGAVTLENITITGDVKIEGVTQVGTVIGSGANANYTASNITVDVNEGSYVSSAKNTNGNSYDYAGGVFGQVWGSSFTNITSNIDVIGCWAYGVGGITGGATGTWKDITCTGDVTILNKDTAVYYTNTNSEGNAYGDVYWWQGAGLISGHHNTVTFENCVATGTLTYAADNTTTNGMYFFNTDGVRCEDNRFGATRFKNDNNVTIID